MFNDIRSDPYRCNYCSYCRAREIAASFYENHIFMDYGISHIQHIMCINGIARRTRSLAIPRRATLSDEIHRENRIKSLLRFDQDSRLKHLAMYVSEFEASRYATYANTLIRALIAILVRLIFHDLFLFVHYILHLLHCIY